MGATATPFQTGRTEPIQLDVRNVSGAPFTGATGVLIRIRRDSDGQYLDFADDTFKGSGWTTRDVATVEVDATLAPGLYELPGGFDSSAVTNLTADDAYTVFPVNSGAGDTVGAVLPAPGEFKVGWFADGVGVAAVVAATIGPDTPDTLRLLAWLQRNGATITTGLTSATVAFKNAAGTTLAGPSVMTGPNSDGVFRIDFASITLANAQQFYASLTVVDSTGSVFSVTASPTIG